MLEGCGVARDTKRGHPARGRRPDPSRREQPEPAHLVAGVVGQPERADQVLDVAASEEASPYFYVRDAAKSQLELEGWVTRVSSSGRDGFKSPAVPLARTR